MAVGTATALAIIGGAGAGWFGSKVMGAQKQMSSPIPLPQAPSISDSTAKAEDVIKKKRATMSQSVFTSPLGVAGEANVARKQLLGQ